MKQYLVDTLNYKDYTTLKETLATKLEHSALENLFWLEIPDSLATEEQKAHAACGPHVVAVELREDAISCEFLVRTKKAMRCSCMGYATDEQILWIIRFLDQLLEENAIIV